MEDSALPALLCIALVVGALIGTVGVGGILLIPAIAAFAGLGMHEAMATALFTFIFTGITGTALFQRKGTIDWRITAPVAAGALVFGFAGAWMNSLATPATLTLLLALIILFAGTYTLAARRGARRPVLAARPAAQQVLLASLGAVAGLGSGLTGVGGPALSVPLMVLFGFPALGSIGASQVVQIIAAVSGTVGNVSFGSIDFGLAAPVAAVESAGVFIGARIAHSVDQRSLRRFVGVLCIPVGLFLIARTLELL